MVLQNVSSVRVHNDEIYTSSNLYLLAGELRNSELQKEEVIKGKCELRNGVLTV